MTLSERVKQAGLDKWTAALLTLALILAVMHHADHVLRVDHSGWPFRQSVTPFTFSLFAYPMLLLALFGPRRWIWWRWGLLATGTTFTLFAHGVIESTRMQYAMWADNRSLDPHAAGLHNLPDVRSPALGIAAVVVGMALNVTALVATASMLARSLRVRRGETARAIPAYVATATSSSYPAAAR